MSAEKPADSRAFSRLADVDAERIPAVKPGEGADIRTDTDTGPDDDPDAGPGTE